MTGQLILEQESRGAGEQERIVGGHPTLDFVGELPSKHTRVIFYFDRGTLYFNDQRLFGWVKIGDKFTIDNLPFIKKLGPEPLEISEKQFSERIIKSKRPIKLVLMDQEILSGMGNIYANDALWEAGVDPKRKACSLTAKQLTNLYQAVIKVLEEGIKYGGATAADAKYMDLHGTGGHYQEHFRVYDREGEECLKGDGGIVKKETLGGRGTYYCPVCQK
jgi:formamidopyrimidine-DNA glycosylase